MNAVADFLHANRERLELDRYGIGNSISTLILVPNFRASRHVVFLVLAERSGDLSLVVKVPRLAFDTSGIASEFSVLKALQRGGAHRGVPKPVALEEHLGVPLFVQTALHGRFLARPLARRRPEAWADSAAVWLATLAHDEPDTEDVWDRLVERPLRSFATTVAEAWAAELVARTLDILRPLREAPFPLVVEHGDFGHPNVVVLPDGGLGAIDWELGEERGLPAQDLCFFLMYLALARSRTTTAARRRAAFDYAFVAPDAWAYPALNQYAERVGFDGELIRPLLVASFARYAARLVRRLAGDGTASAALVGWLRDDRACDLWRHSVARAPELNARRPTKLSAAARRGARPTA